MNPKKELLWGLWEKATLKDLGLVQGSLKAPGRINYGVSFRFLGLRV